jgi:AraC-like DNA-binding protein
MIEPRHVVYRPCEFLRPWVREVLWIESTVPRDQILLPETAFTLMLRQSGAGSISQQPLGRAILSGLQQRTRYAGHTANSAFLVVRFTETGAATLLRDRVDQLYGQTIPLDTVLAPTAIESLQSRLAETPHPQQKFSLVERFLCRSIRPDAAPSTQIIAAARFIRATNGRASIAALARKVGMSQSALERHFSAAVGASPKTLSRLARLHHVCHLWDRGLSLTDIAHAAGYTDQPHLTRDFRALSGAAPTEFFRSGLLRNLPTFYK